MPIKKLPYSKNELFDFEKSNIYSGEKLNQIAFPVGGIGTGTISLSGRGELIDWEIFNRPNKGSANEFSFFTLNVQFENRRDAKHCVSTNTKSITKILQAKPVAPFIGEGFGVKRENGAGLPHFESCIFRGEYPFAYIDFYDPQIPLDIQLEAYNPLIPLNDIDSGIPVAIYNFYIKNQSRESIKINLCANLFNAGGYPGYGNFRCDGLGKNVNEFLSEQNIRGLFMYSKKYKKDNPQFGSLALTTSHKNISYQCYWMRGTWFDNLQAFWDEFSQTGRLVNRDYPPSKDGSSDVGSICLHTKLKPQESILLPIYISWYFPNFEKYWGNVNCGIDNKCQSSNLPVWKNYYAQFYKDAFDVARYVTKNIKRLYCETKKFKDALFSSSLPQYVLDAISSQISIIRTPTCIRLQDGTFYGFEGCHHQSGCCEGTCSHVWNYAQALPFLFPNLERSIREAEYKYSLAEDGRMGFRLQLPLGSDIMNFHAAADGLLGGIMRVYREWKISGDDEWLKKIWNKVKRSLKYVWKYWDADKDGVIEGLQHNTYDIEFYGPNTMIGSFYLGALRVAEEMALYLDEQKEAKEYRRVFENGKKWMDENLFNGEYYIQKINPDADKNSPYPPSTTYKEDVCSTCFSRNNISPLKWELQTEIKYQYGNGCLSDQLIGQWFSHILDLGYVFSKENIKKALQSIFKYNWRTDFSGYPNCQRIYALNDEKGLLLCSWRENQRPQFPFPYADEVWSGIEYQVASHLIYEGFIEEGLAIVKGVRERYDGYKRNPYDEIECGHHYARSMASYSLLLALSGFKFDSVNKMIGFIPRIRVESFKSFWSLNKGWGFYQQDETKKGINIKFKVLYGFIHLKVFETEILRKLRLIKVFLNDIKINCDYDLSEQFLCLRFDKVIKVKEGNELDIEIKF